MTAGGGTSLGRHMAAGSAWLNSIRRRGLSSKDEEAGLPPSGAWFFEAGWPSPAPLPQGERGDALTSPGPCLERGSLPQGPSPLTPLPEGEGEPPVGYRRAPVATRFKSGRSGNPRGRPKRARHLGALVAAALGERVAVEEEDGRVRRLSKLEATVRQIVNGAASGDARSIKLLFVLIKTDDRALAEPEPRRPGERSEADAVVLAELRRRFGRPSPPTPSPPAPLPVGARLSGEVVGPDSICRGACPARPRNSVRFLGIFWLLSLRKESGTCALLLPFSASLSNPSTGGGSRRSSSATALTPTTNRSTAGII